MEAQRLWSLARSHSKNCRHQDTNPDWASADQSCSVQERAQGRLTACPPTSRRGWVETRTQASGHCPSRPLRPHRCGGGRWPRPPGPCSRKELCSRRRASYGDTDPSTRPQVLIKDPSALGTLQGRRRPPSRWQLRARQRRWAPFVTAGGGVRQALSGCGTAWQGPDWQAGQETSWRPWGAEALAGSVRLWRRQRGHSTRSGCWVPGEGVREPSEPPCPCGQWDPHPRLTPGHAQASEGQGLHPAGSSPAEPGFGTGRPWVPEGQTEAGREDEECGRRGFGQAGVGTQSDPAV